MAKNSGSSSSNEEEVLLALSVTEKIKNLKVNLTYCEDLLIHKFPVNALWYLKAAAEDEHWSLEVENVEDGSLRGARALEVENPTNGSLKAENAEHVGSVRAGKAGEGEITDGSRHLITIGHLRSPRVAVAADLGCARSSAVATDPGHVGLFARSSAVATDTGHLSSPRVVAADIGHAGSSAVATCTGNLRSFAAAVRDACGGYKPCCGY